MLVKVDNRNTLIRFMSEGHDAVGDCQHYDLLGVTSCSLVYTRAKVADVKHPYRYTKLHGVTF